MRKANTAKVGNDVPARTLPLRRLALLGALPPGGTAPQTGESDTDGAESLFASLAPAWRECPPGGRGGGGVGAGLAPWGLGPFAKNKRHSFWADFPAKFPVKLREDDIL